MARAGRFEIRAKVPYGRGLWPAFWTLGSNIGTAGWPLCGEIDIFEIFGTKNGKKVKPGRFASAHLYLRGRLQPGLTLPPSVPAGVEGRACRKTV